MKDTHEPSIEIEYKKLMKEFNDFKYSAKRHILRYRSKLKDASLRENSLERSLAAAYESQQEAWLALEKEKESQDELKLLLHDKEIKMSEAESRNTELETSVRMVEESNVAWRDSHADLERTVDDLKRQLDTTLDQIEVSYVHTYIYTYMHNIYILAHNLIVFYSNVL